MPSTQDSARRCAVGVDNHIIMRLVLALLSDSCEYGTALVVVDDDTA
jgi:hypothetical protein